MVSHWSGLSVTLPSRQAFAFLHSSIVLRSIVFPEHPSHLRVRIPLQSWHDQFDHSAKDSKLWCYSLCWLTVIRINTYTDTRYCLAQFFTYLVFSTFHLPLHGDTSLIEWDIRKMCSHIKFSTSKMHRLYRLSYLNAILLDHTVSPLSKMCFPSNKPPVKIKTAVHRWVWFKYLYFQC